MDGKTDHQLIWIVHYIVLFNTLVKTDQQHTCDLKDIFISNFYNQNLELKLNILIAIMPNFLNDLLLISRYVFKHS